MDIERDAKRSFGININEPEFEKTDNGLLSQMTIDFQIEIEQSEGQTCKIELSLEGTFISACYFCLLGDYSTSGGGLLDGGGAGGSDGGATGGETDGGGNLNEMRDLNT